MGYAYYRLPDGREGGYGVSAPCDRHGCPVTIDRGLGCLCGSWPDGHRSDTEPGCGRYFCPAHLDSAAHDCPNPHGAATCYECGDTVPADADLHPASDGRDLCSDCHAEFHLSLEEPAPDTTGTAAAR